MSLLTKHVSRERTTSGWLLLAAVLLFVALAARFFAQQVYVADDLGEFHLPVRDFYARQLAAGESFDWMPSLYGGFYVAGEGQLGGYHPWHWMLYRSLPLGAAFNVELLSSYPFLFAGTYFLLRRLVGRRDAALVGATAFSFGGFALLHFIHPNAIAVVAHLPWLLWAIDVVLDESAGGADQAEPIGGIPSLALRAKMVLRASARSLAVGAIGLLTASQLLLGYPQYVWFSLLAEGGFALYLVVTRGVRIARLVGVALAVVAGILMGAIQWIPTWHLLSDSVRQTASREFANTGSLHPLNLVQLVAPYLFEKRVVGQNTHELGLYLGAVPLVLIVWLFARRTEWGKYRPLIRALLVGVIVSLLLAAGEFGGLYRIQAWLPLVSRFRFPCRAIVLVQLFLAALAAVGAAMLFAEQERNETPGGHRASKPLLILLLVSMAVALLAPLLWTDHVARPLLVWSGPALIAMGVLSVTLVKSGARAGVAILALFMAADLGVYGLSYSVWGRTADLHSYVAAIPRPPQFAGERVAAPDAPNKLRTGDRMLLAGIQRVDGYAGLEPAKQLDYADPSVLAAAGVAWQLERTGEGAPSPHEWKRISPSAPRVRLVTQSLPESELPRVGSLDWHAAVCAPEQQLPKSEPGTAIVISDRPGVMVIEVSAPARQVLATTESFDSGWTASIGGQRVPVVRVNGDFLGCAIEPGKQLVRLEFRPRAWRVGGWLAMLGLGFLTVAVSLTAANSCRPRAVGGV